MDIDNISRSLLERLINKEVLLNDEKHLLEKQRSSKESSFTDKAHPDEGNELKKPRFKEPN
jgi:hypothetical protein